MLKNVASQKWRVYAWDTTTGAAKTGDAANITAYIRKDDGASAATDDTNPTEADSTNEPGYYDFDLTQAETNATKLTLVPKSSTSGVAVIACPPVVYTRPPGFDGLAIANNAVAANLTHWKGAAPADLADTDKVRVDVRAYGGTAGTFSGGRPEVNVSHWGGTAVGSTEVRANLISIAGSAVDTSAAQLGVNVVNAGGTAWGSGAITAGSIAAAALDDKGNWLKPTTAGRTLDVTAGGCAGIDWANVESPTATLALTGTTISTGQTVASVSGAVGSVTGNVGGNVTGTVGGFTAAAKAELRQEAEGALAAYDPPTNAEMEARTLAAASYATASGLATVAGHLGDEVAAVRAKTDNLPASPAAAGGAMALTSGERSTLAAAILDLSDGVEPGVTLRQFCRAAGAILAGIVSGAGTGTEVFKALAATGSGTTRVTVTVDGDGNRSAVSLNL